MKILHLYSDWKWTGPAEPAIQMCKGLEEQGHEVLFACRATPPEHADCEETVEMKAAEYGINFTTQFGLNRYWGLKDSLHDLWHLPRFIKNEGFDVVHTHLSHDHAMGAYATKMIRKSKRPTLIKSMHRREVLADKFANRLLLSDVKGKNGLLVFTESFRQKYAERFHIDPKLIGLTPMPLDIQRFHKARPFACQREAYNMGQDTFLIGIVARFQKYRRMDVFMEAAAKVVKAAPHVKFVVIGRSGQIQETVIKPMKALGIEDHVILPGYLIDNYVDMMQTLDVFTLMTPGFDGTARAMREAMALGKPCVVSDVGMLPDIVQHEKSGLVFPFTDADQLAASWLRLVQDEEARRQMGDYAATYARDNFRLDLVGPALTSFYQERLGTEAKLTPAYN